MVNTVKKILKEQYVSEYDLTYTELLFDDNYWDLKETVTGEEDVGISDHQLWTNEGTLYVNSNRDDVDFEEINQDVLNMIASELVSEALFEEGIYYDDYEIEKVFISGDGIGIDFNVWKTTEIDEPQRDYRDDWD